MTQVERQQVKRDTRHRIEMYMTAEEFENLRYLKREWATLHTRSQVVNAAIGYLAKKTREGLKSF